MDNPISATQAGEEFDLLSITGAFTHGGSVVIDVSEFTLPGGSIPLKLIGWSSEIGSSASTNVSVVGGTIPVQFQSDGLYVLIPEPATLGLFGIAATGVLGRRRR